MTAEQAVVFDPFCGSGTLLLEAAMIRFDRAPGLTRLDWGFQRWRGHDQSVWADLVEQAKQRFESACSERTGCFIGYDNDVQMLAVAEQNAIRLGLSAFCQWQKGNAEQVVAPELPAKLTLAPLLVCNPPYGERLGEEIQTLLLYRRFGAQLRQYFQGWQVAVLAGDDSLLKRMKLRSLRKYKLFNGALETTLALYDLTQEQPEFTQAQSSDLANRLKKNYQKFEK